MRRILLLVTAAILVAACSRPERGGKGQHDGGDSLAAVAAVYSGKVYDQGNTEGCWIYALCACIEHEAWLRGDSVELSRQWLMSRLLEEQALERYDILTSGEDNIEAGGRGTLSLRGVGPEVIRLIERYGLVPRQHERSGIVNSRVLQRKLALLADNAAARRQTREAFIEGMRRLLPAFTVARHQRVTHGSADGEELSFYYLSMRYTPQQFAESVMYCQRWRWYASEETHPWDESFALEVPDNRRYHEYVNKPMAELTRMVKESLRQGHAVYWEFGEERSRQEGGGGATSDHAMAIVGMVGDRFVCLNSYGRDWGHGGCCLITEEYFREHTCNVGIIEDTEW